MLGILKKVALPCLSIAAFSFAARVAQAEPVQFSTELLFTSGNAVSTNPVGPGPLSDPTQLTQNTPGSISNGFTSVATFNDNNAAKGTSSLTYNGEQNLVNVDAAGDFVNTTFGNFSADITARSHFNEHFSLYIYEYKPQDPGGHLTFDADITGTVTVANDQLTITWDHGIFDPLGMKLLPIDPGKPPYVWYKLNDFPTETVTPNVGPTDEIAGSVAAAPLPKTVGVSLALFGILSVFGFAKRKSFTLA